MMATAAARKKNPPAADSLVVGNQQDELSRMHMFVAQTTWVATTNEPCLYDLHTFAGFPYGAPVSFDARTGKYRCVGFFCSPSCAKSWALQRLSPKSVAVFDAFMHTVHGLKRVPEAQPIERLVKLLAEHGNRPDEAMRLWRQPVSGGGSVLRRVPGLFIRCTQAFEEQQQRHHDTLQHEHSLQMMDTKPVPLVLTESGQRQQMTYVKRKIEKISAPPAPASMGSIDRLMGIRPKKIAPAQ